MSLDGAALGEQMIGAGAAAFGNEWNTAKSFAIAEFKTLGVRLETIAKQTADGLHPQLAKSLFDAQVRTAIQIIAGSTILTLLAVEAAINAVLDVIRETVNGAIGFVLF